MDLRKVDSEKLISVIVPAYNVEKYIVACLTSLINQTYKDIEIIIIDDKSDDGTLELCEAYQRQDARIKILHQNRGGAARARNLGMENARGSYYMFVDSDDQIHLQMIEKLFLALKNNNADISVCGYEEIQENENASLKKEKKTKKSETEVLSRLDAQMQALGNRSINYVVPWAKLYKKKTWEHIKFPALYALEDEYTYYKVLDKSKTVIYLNESLYYYRVRSGSIMHNVPKWNPVLLDAWRKRAEYFRRNQDRKLFYYAALRVLGLLQWRISLIQEEESSTEEEIQAAVKTYRQQYHKYVHRTLFPIRLRIKCFLGFKQMMGQWKSFFRYKKKVGNFLRSLGIQC